MVGSGIEFLGIQNSNGIENSSVSSSYGTIQYQLVVLQYG
jgi:hypothetical protein